MAPARCFEVVACAQLTGVLPGTVDFAPGPARATASGSMALLWSLHDFVMGRTAGTGLTPALVGLAESSLPALLPGRDDSARLLLLLKLAGVAGVVAQPLSVPGVVAAAASSVD